MNRYGRNGNREKAFSRCWLNYDELHRFDSDLLIAVIFMRFNWRNLGGRGLRMDYASWFLEMMRL